MLLTDKVVFITGGAQGIGKAVAEAVLKKGAKVCLADVNAEQGETSVKELMTAYGQDKAMFSKCDVTDAASLQDAFRAAVSQFGHIDVMCNNAGIMDERIWEREIDINFTGVVRGTNLAIEHMRKDNGGNGGVIINTSSVAGLLKFIWCPVYSGTKAAVHHFTSCHAINPEMKKNGIRFACICPEGAKTALLDMDDDQIINLSNFKETMVKMTLCSVEQVVEAFLKAMEDDSLNGSLITISGRGGIVIKQQTLGPVDTPPPE